MAATLGSSCQYPARALLGSYPPLSLHTYYYYYAKEIYHVVTSVLCSMLLCYVCLCYVLVFDCLCTAPDITLSLFTDYGIDFVLNKALKACVLSQQFIQHKYLIGNPGVVPG